MLLKTYALYSVFIVKPDKKWAKLAEQDYNWTYCLSKAQLIRS